MENALLETTLSSIGDAVIATDAQGNITFLNPEAQRLTGWRSEEAFGLPLRQVFRIVNESTRKTVENPVEKVIQIGAVVGLANHTVLIARDGREIPIDDSAAPIRNSGGPLLGVVLVFRDITERRKAELAQSHLAAIVEFSGDAMITKNLHGIIQSWNSSAQRLFGYSAGEIVGQPVTVLFPPDRLGEEDYIIALLQQGRPVERLQTVRVAKDGRHIPVSVSVSPIKNPEGQIIGASKIIHDITDLVATREALLKEKEILSTTLASIGDAVIVTGPNGCVTFLNTEAQRLTKWTNQDAVGRPLKEVFRIINESSRNPVEDPVEKVFRLGTVVGLANHTLLIAKDGTEIPIDDSAAPITTTGGPLHGVVLVFRDFTERKATEAELRNLALLPAQNPAPIIRVAANGALLYANPAAKSIFDQHQFLPGSPAPDPLRAFAAEALQHNAPTQRELSRRDRQYLLTVAPVQHLGYANFYASDITDRRHAEESLRLAHRELADRAVQLEKLVAERTAKLTEMVHELQHVSYAIVHDMRAPLRAMNTFALEIQDGLSARAPHEELEPYCNRIIRAAHRLDKLIQDTLNYTTTVLDDVKLHPVDLARLLPDLIESYPNLQPLNAEIIIENHLPVVLGEESLLTQCFSNLLGNAVKFVAPGVRPKIRVSASPAPQVRGSASLVRITIEDNGIGIPPQAHSRVFGMFERLTSSYEGTGIGLAIVRKVVKRMNGEVSFDSAPGRGSRFFVDLQSVSLPP